MPKRRTRVVWLIKGLGLGGAEKLLVLALPYLDRESFEYEVVYFLPWKNLQVPDLERAGVRVRCLEHRRAFDPRSILRLARLFRERRPDIVHMHLPYAAIVGRIAARAVPATKLVYTEHNVIERYHWLTAWANRITYKLNDAVICVSAAVRQSVLAHYNVTDHPTIHTVYNGMNPRDVIGGVTDRMAMRRSLGVPDGDRMVVDVASFTPKKRHEDLLRAAQIIRAQRSDVSFVLVGDGPLRATMEQLSATLGIREKVVFTGVRRDAIDIMHAGDLVVLPSKFEALGIVLLEAMALRRPIVASRTGGIPEIVTDGAEGLLTEPCNPADLASKILAVLDDPALASRLAENGFRRVEEQFSLESMVHRTEAIYRSVLERSD